ncbi:MAG: hypothetical protein AB7I27_15155 [Bacteriovoracaceae bacterium]
MKINLILFFLLASNLSWGYECKITFRSLKILNNEIFDEYVDTQFYQMKSVQACAKKAQSILQYSPIIIHGKFKAHEGIIWPQKEYPYAEYIYDNYDYDLGMKDTKGRVQRDGPLFGINPIRDENFKIIKK